MVSSCSERPTKYCTVNRWWVFAALDATLPYDPPGFTHVNQHSRALLMAGIPQLNSALYHRIRFLVGDPVAYVQIPAAKAG